MNPSYLSPLANHLWQSTLFAGIAGLLTLLLRNNRARVRHGVWLVASWKFLIPFSALVLLGDQIHWRTAPQTPQSILSVAMGEISQPFTSAISLPSSAGLPAESPIPALLWGIWACGFLGISCSWCIRWRRIRAAVRAGSPVNLEIPIRAVSSPLLFEPGVFGIFRPVLLLPEGILGRLTAPQLKGVIAHELCHVYHRDNLIAAIQMFVETVFWFHPMVWWIGKRMLAERELACDEEAVQMGNEPRVYAEGILNVCKLYAESPLRCVSGVTGSNLKKRIEAVMSNRVAVRLSVAKITVLAVAGVTALATPILVGMMDALPILAQSQQSSVQLPRAATPKFEVASVKPCKGNDLPPGRKRGDAGGKSSPATLRIDCTPVRSLINQAYVLFANGHVNTQVHAPVEGGPGWIDSESYQIDAKTESPQSQGMMHGPMLQALLEERFKVKIRRETREVPAYALTVAKGGPKLRPFKEGSCTPLDPKLLEQFPPQPFPELPPGQKYCGGIDAEGNRWVMASGTSNGPTEILYASALNIDDFIKMSLSRRVGRPVINRTGLTGRFDYHLELFQTRPCPDSSPAGLPPRWHPILWARRFLPPCSNSLG